ncbi:MAG: DegV family EDD domain-containing protein [Lachnospiraceae bacterium]|nr:DegV family EDD domain-containing protein [Lachnospiraceae bacterium]
MKKYFFDNSIPPEHKTFVFYILITQAILFLSFVGRMIVIGYNPNTLTMLASFISTFVISSFFYVTKKAKTCSVILALTMSLGFFPFMFFTGGGIWSDSPIWLIYIVVMICNIFPKNTMVKNIFLFIADVTAVGSYVLAEYHPELITYYSEFKTHILMFITLLLVMTALSIILHLSNWSNSYQFELLEKQNKEIEGLVASQNRFFSSMSHEIRTPINTIIGLNEMILREDISDEITEDAINIRSAGRMLLNTVNDILDMSKFQSGDMKLLVDNYNTGNMLSEIVGMLWIKAKEKNLDFNINVSPDVPAELRGDEVRIKQVLMNVLNNAIKYTKEGSVSLSVECAKLGDGSINMIYTVKDTGKGIRKEDIPYLFTAFKRVDESSNRHIEGTGLGLSIVKQFLDLMGGKVTVNSVYTKGSTFIIEIPQKAASDKEIGEYDYKKKHRLSGRVEYKQSFEAPEAKLLVVDDNESNLLVVTKLLRDTKIQIDTAKSGAEALAKTLDKRYDLIFMDHLMPEMDGIECFNAIRNQVGGKCKDTNIVVLTANADEDNRRLYAIAGFNGYLVKPITGRILETEILHQLPDHLITKLNVADESSSSGFSMMTESERKKKIIITTESTADLPPSLIEKYGIKVFHQKIKTDSGIFREGLEMDTYGLLEYLEDEKHIATPIPPEVSEYEEFFAENLAYANNIIHISLTSNLEKSSYPVALSAANSFDNVTVFDTKSISCGQGVFAILASRMAEAGMSVPEIIVRLENYISRVRASFFMNNMDYLARTGNTSVSYANFAKSIMLRPISVIKNGVITPGGFLLGSTRKTWKKYINLSLKGFRIESEAVFVNYVGISKKDLEWIRKEIEEKHKFKQIFFQETCPVVAVSIGPGSFGIVAIQKK